MRPAIRAFCCIGAVCLLAGTARGQVLRNNPADFELSVTPNSISISRNEPLEVRLSLRNIRDEPRILHIRGSLTIELSLTHVMPSGIRLRTPGPTWARGGDIFYPGGEATVEPGQTFTQPLLISEWIDSFSEGRHIIEIRWGENPPVFVTVDVGPRDETRLRRIVAQLAEAARLPRSPEESERSAAAIEKLLSTHDEAVLPIAVQLAKDSWTELAAIEMLKEFDSPVAVDALGDLFRRKTGGDDRRLLESRLMMLRNRSARSDVRAKIDAILAEPQPAPPH